MIRRLPKIVIKDPNGTGFGAKLYPIMGMVPKPKEALPAAAVHYVYCPGKNNRNMTGALEIPVTSQIDYTEPTPTPPVVPVVQTTPTPVPTPTPTPTSNPGYY